MNLMKSEPNFANGLFRWDEGSLTTKVSTEIVQPNSELQTSFVFLKLIT